MEKFQKIVVTGFVYNKGKTLLLKRSSKESFLPEYWELPGGKVNFGEIPEDGLVREYKEETGLEISVGKPFRTFSYVSSDSNRHTVEIVYECFLKGGEVLISDAHSEFARVSENDIKELLISDEMSRSVRKGFDIFR